jgi:hypothetical protein
MAVMAANPCVARHKEYLIFTLACLFYFFYASACSIVAKQKIIIAK